MAALLIIVTPSFGHALTLGRARTRHIVPRGDKWCPTQVGPCRQQKPARGPVARPPGAALARAAHPRRCEPLTVRPACPSAVSDHSVPGRRRRSPRESCGAIIHRVQPSNSSVARHVSAVQERARSFYPVGSWAAASIVLLIKNRSERHRSSPGSRGPNHSVAQTKQERTGRIGNSWT